MTRLRPVRASSGPVALLVILLSGCGTEGTTPDCPGYPDPYDVRVPMARDRAVGSALELAFPPYTCMTLPDGFDQGASGAGGQPELAEQAGFSGAGEGP